MSSILVTTTLSPTSNIFPNAIPVFVSMQDLEFGTSSSRMDDYGNHDAFLRCNTSTDTEYRTCGEQIDASFVWRSLSKLDTFMLLANNSRLAKSKCVPFVMKDFTEYLQPELVDIVLSYLTDRELVAFSKCCIRWREISNKDQLWLHHCMSRGWLRYGLNGDINRENHLNVQMTNVGGNSPVFHLDVPEDTRLSTVCKWKNIYMRVHHLNNNWRKGRYTVSPLLRGHTEKVTALACNGKFIVSGSEDKSLRLWDMAMAKCLRKLDGHLDTITSIIWKGNSDSSRSLRNQYNSRSTNVSHDHSIYIIAKPPIVKLINFCMMFDVTLLHYIFPNKGNTLITGCADSSIRIIDSTNFNILFSLQGHSGSVDHMTLVGKVLVSAATDRTLRLWYVPDRKLVNILRGHTDDIECMCSHGTHVVTGSWDKTLILWDIGHAEMVRMYDGHSEVVTCVHFTGEKIISGSGDSHLRIWSVSSRKCLHTLKGHEGEVYCMACTNTVIASGSSDSSIRVWDYNGRCKYTLQGHLGIVRCLHICDERLISGGDQKKIVIWNYKTGEQMNVVHRHPSLLHLMWVNETKLITASPERPGTITVLSFW